MERSISKSERIARWLKGHQRERHRKHISWLAKQLTRHCEIVELKVSCRRSGNVVVAPEVALWVNKT